MPGQRRAFRERFARRERITGATLRPTEGDQEVGLRGGGATGCACQLRCGHELLRRPARVAIREGGLGSFPVTLETQAGIVTRARRTRDQFVLERLEDRVGSDTELPREDTPSAVQGIERVIHPARVAQGLRQERPTPLPKRFGRNRCIELGDGGGGAVELEVKRE